MTRSKMQRKPNSVTLLITRTTAPVVAVELWDHAADAVRKLASAQATGVYRTEVKPDAIARMLQAGVPFKWFADAKLGTGARQCWLRFDTTGGTAFVIAPNPVENVASSAETQHQVEERRLRGAIQRCNGEIAHRLLVRRLKNNMRSRTMKQALKRLFDAGVIDVHKALGSNDTHYTLLAA